MIEMECPHCGKTSQAPDEYLGRVGRCPGCQGRVQIGGAVSLVVGETGWVETPSKPQPVVLDSDQPRTRMPSPRKQVSSKAAIRTRRSARFAASMFQGVSLLAGLISVLLVIPSLSWFTSAHKNPADPSPISFLGYLLATCFLTSWGAHVLKLLAIEPSFEDED